MPKSKKQKNPNSQNRVLQNKKRNTQNKNFPFKKALKLLHQSSKATTVDEALKTITNEVCALVGGKGGSIWLKSSQERHKVVLRWTYRQHGSNIVGKSYYTNIKSSDGYYDGLTGWVFATGKPLLLKDIRDENEIKKYPNLKWKDKYGGYKDADDKDIQKYFIAVPIFSCRTRREVIGILRIGSSERKRGFNETHLKLLKIYAGYMSGLLTNYIKQDDERLLVERLLTIAGQSDQEDLLNESVNTLPLVMDGCYCSIFLPQNGTVVLEATNSPKLEKLTRKNDKDNCIIYQLGQGKTGIVAKSGNTILRHGNVSSKTGYPCECDEPSTFLATAIRPNINEKPWGVVRVARELNKGAEFDEVDQQFLENFSRLLYQCLSINGCLSKGKCFVIMPFYKGLDDIFLNIIRPTVEEFGLICKREDDYSIGELPTRILSHIANANLIIAEITDSNPNVYYELGIAHTLKKTVILMSQDQEPPSDIRHWKFLHYRNNIGEDKKLIKKLQLAIQEAKDQNLIWT